MPDDAITFQVPLAPGAPVRIDDGDGSRRATVAYAAKIGRRAMLVTEADARGRLLAAAQMAFVAGVVNEGLGLHRGRVAGAKARRIDDAAAVATMQNVALHHPSWPVAWLAKVAALTHQLYKPTVSEASVNRRLADVYRAVRRGEINLEFNSPPTLGGDGGKTLEGTPTEGDQDHGP